MLNPGCYECLYRGDIPGDAHSTCRHPLIKPLGNDPLIALLTIAGGGLPPSYAAAIIALGIKANPHGIKMGWFFWPFNFDPVWLEECRGWTPKEATDGC